MTAAVIDVEPGRTAAGSGNRRIGLGRWILQPLVCVAAVAGCLIYVQIADVSPSEQRSLGVPSLITLLRQHMTVSLAATLLTCAVGIPLGIALTRGVMRRYSKPIITVAGFGQAAPAIGLIALGAVLFGIGPLGAVVALTAVNYQGVQKTAWLTRIIVVIVLAALATVVVASLAIALVRPGGTLVQASCSSRVTADDFAATVLAAAGRSARRVHELRRTGHAVDHPVGFAQGAYLKAIYLRVE